MLLIDAFNILHLPGAVRDGHAIGLADLASLLGTSRYTGQRAILVCDGAGPDPAARGKSRRGRARIAGAELVFSGRDSTADDEIEALLRRAGGHGVTVVSDDRRLRRAASRAGARSLGSERFLAHLLADHAKPKAKPAPRFSRDIPLDRYSVAHWMQTFGISPNGLLDRRAGKAPPPGERRRPPGPGPAEPRASRQPDNAPQEAPPIPDERVLRMESLAEDPVIREALEDWEGRLSLDDLDMARWLSEHPPRDDDQT